MFSTRGSSGAGPASAAAWRRRSRVAAISSEERGGNPFCNSRKRAISGSSGIGGRAQHGENLSVELRVRLPRLRGHHASVAHHVLVHERAARQFGLALHVVIARHVLAIGEPGSREDLYAVADRKDPLARGVEGAQERQQSFVVAQVFRRPAAKQQDRLIVLYAHTGEIHVRLYPISRTFYIGIPAGLEVVHDQIETPARRRGDGGLPPLLLETVQGIQGLVRLAAIARDD